MGNNKNLANICANVDLKRCAINLFSTEYFVNVLIFGSLSLKKIPPDKKLKIPIERNAIFQEKNEEIEITPAPDMSNPRRYPKSFAAATFAKFSDLTQSVSKLYEMMCRMLVPNFKAKISRKIIRRFLFGLWIWLIKLKVVKMTTSENKTQLFF